ncbi:MAG TPA: patatin-like phospholipase family protein [Candidatus Acidoferrum sp.]|nr:patatin-like phospholipase family protein [Candidatus Acidoferrum sp.]
MKRALALAGGGPRGSYEIGAWKALRELGYTFDIVTGTSIGAINGVLIVQDDIETAHRLWEQVTADKVMVHGLSLNFDMSYYIENRDSILPFFKRAILNKGVDITPLKEMFDHYINEDKFFRSPIDFGLMTARFPSLTPVSVRKSDVAPGYLPKWVLASASCFPAFPLCEVDGAYYIDGGYVNHLPVDLAFKMGAEEVVAIELRACAAQHAFFGNPLVTFVEPSRPLGSYLSFDTPIIANNLLLGYNDVMRSLGGYFGSAFTFAPSPSWERREQEIARTLSDLLRVELDSKTRLLGSATPFADRMLKQGAAAGKSPCYFFQSAVETYMAMFDYDPYPAYDVDAVMDDLVDRVRHSGDERIARVAKVNRVLERGEVEPWMYTEPPEILLLAVLLMTVS